MIGIDLFKIQRKTIFHKKVLDRFFFKSELKIIEEKKDTQLFAAKIWAIKESVYKLLHNLYPDLWFNKLAIEVSCKNFVFKIKYNKQNDPNINILVDSINWENIYISDSDEGDYLVVVAIMK